MRGALPELARRPRWPVAMLSRASSVASLVSSPLSGVSVHHPGKVTTFETAEAVENLLKYARSFDVPTAAFDLKAYNSIKKSQAVKGDALCAMLPLVESVLEWMPGLRFRPTQLQEVLEAVDSLLQVNSTNRNRQDWARATTISMGVVLTHARRLRNAELFAQCVAKTSQANASKLEDMREKIVESCPLSPHSCTDDALIDESQPKEEERAKKRRIAREEEWPDFSSTELEGEGCPGQMPWPEFESEEEGEPRERVASGPAPSQLSAKQRKQLHWDLERSTRYALPGKVRFRKDVGAKPSGEARPQNRLVLSIGEVRIEKKAHKTIIQLNQEDKWKSVCTVSETNSVNHRKVIAEIFKLAGEQDLDQEAMIRHRTRLLQEEE